MISIIIPTLNEESVIVGTIQKLKNGLSLPHEIIISDGNSKDRTIELARQYADKVIVHTEARRQTIAEGRNCGAKAASGEYLAFFDADCSVENPNQFFTEALTNLQNPKIAALVPWIEVLKEHATFSDKLVYTIYNRYLYILNNVFGFGVAGGEFQMMRRSDFEKVGGFNEQLTASEDVELLGRLSKLGKIYLNPKLVVLHTSRRAHKIGWPKLLSLWIANSVSMMIHKKAYSKEWEPIR